MQWGAGDAGSNPGKVYKFLLVKKTYLGRHWTLDPYYLLFLRFWRLVVLRSILYVPMTRLQYSLMATLIFIHAHPQSENVNVTIWQSDAHQAYNNYWADPSLTYREVCDWDMEPLLGGPIPPPPPGNKKNCLFYDFV